METKHMLASTFGRQLPTKPCHLLTDRLSRMAVIAACVMTFLSSCTEIKILDVEQTQPRIENKITLTGVKTFFSTGTEIQKIITAGDTTYREDLQQLEMKGIGLDLFEEKQKIGSIAARRATLFLREKPSLAVHKNDIRFIRDTTYEGKDGTFFHTNDLHWNNAAEKLLCEKDFTLRIPTEGGFLHVDGTGFEAWKSLDEEKEQQWQFNRWIWKNATLRLVTTKEHK